MNRLLTPLVAVLALAVAGTAQAADSVKVGAIYPLSGNSALAGQAAKAAVELAVELVNEKHPELGDAPLMATAGL
ncbi:MAG TPA: ABC transporter substrate-binding protein, partial [Alphaproteobacteria bacterium]|nr:ABC transporter substrate-binding protein [Alphaproteobacteria bacterium]